MNLVREQLMAAGGYVCLRDDKTVKILYPDVINVYQKCVRGDGEKLYFIEVFEYGNAWEARGQFTRGTNCFNVLLLHVTSVADMQDFFHDIFHLMGCTPFDG